MGSVAYINESDVDRPRPICVREGDIYKCVVFNDDLPFGFRQGGFVYVLVNCNLFFGLYVIDTEDGPTLVRLALCENGLKIKIESLHPSYESHECRPSEVKIIGRVTELFPTGSNSDRLVYYEEGLVFHSQERPYIIPKFQH